ncbi:MAG: V-type ATP synthase subunit I [Conexivisphaerales archaeon]
MRPAKMSRIAVVGSKDKRQLVLSILHDLGVMQVETLSADAANMVRNEIDTITYREVNEELLRIRALRAALPPRPIQQRMRFSSLSELLQVSNSINIDSEVSELQKKQEALLASREQLLDKKNLVQNLKFLNADLSVLSLSSATSFYGKIPRKRYETFEQMLKQLEGVLIYTQKEDEDYRLVLTVPHESLEKFGSIIQKLDIKLQRIPELNGKADEVTAEIDSEIKKIEEQLSSIKERLGLLSDKYYSTLSSVEEQLTIEAKKLEVISSIGFTQSTFVMEGWVATDTIPVLQEALDSYTDSKAFVFEIKTDEKPPTLMRNPKRLRLFESFIRFYSLPQPYELDPTPIFALIFPVFFGLMLGDVGYGAIILLISIWIIRHVRKGGRTIMPKFLLSFAKKILSPSQYAKVAAAMLPGAVLGIIFGFLFDGYFGFPLNKYFFPYLNSAFGLHLPESGAFLDPLSTLGLKSLLLISGYIGLFAVSLGLVIGALNSYWLKEFRHMLGKIGWLMVSWGIALTGLALLHHQVINPVQNPFVAIYLAVLLGGFGLVIAGEGAGSLIELPSMISHIISYTRLLGILLASVVLAGVIDQVFLGAVRGGVFLGIFGVVVLVVGQAFNLILALFEPGIQGARLLYVEFFSNFFHGHGKRFSPFGGERKYTLKEIELPAKKKEK